MKTFVIREKQGQILLPLPQLVHRLDFLPIAAWAFREITIRYPQPFNLRVQEFERLTRELTLGFIVSNHDFRKFLKADFQIIDGCLDAYSNQFLHEPLIRIECVDTTQWEITTVSASIEEELKRNGFKE